MDDLARVIARMTEAVEKEAKLLHGRKDEMCESVKLHHGEAASLTIRSFIELNFVVSNVMIAASIPLPKEIYDHMQDGMTKAQANMLVVALRSALGVPQFQQNGGDAFNHCMRVAYDLAQDFERHQKRLEAHKKELAELLRKGHGPQNG